MLFRSAKSEATEKAYCDEELAKTEAKKGELDSAITKLASKIDLAAAKSAGLKEDVKTLGAELATLAKQQASMDGIRAEEKAAFDTNSAEMKKGINGVQLALKVLNEYYAKDAAHASADGAGSGIIGLFEVCESDFATNLVKEETAESDAQEAYEEMTQESKVNTATNEQDVKYKTQEYVSLDKSVSELSSDRENLNMQLDAVLEYDAKIKDRCIAKPETYEERTKRRTAEIEGLKQALQILEEETDRKSVV